jgi:hypothetical protein
LAAVPSLAVVMSATTPAVAAAGDAIGRMRLLELARESVTVIVAFPGAAMSELETDAARSLLSPNCVDNTLPFQFTSEVFVKP